MSVSEKLRALEAGYSCPNERLLRAALPQLVAVVEAAERAEPFLLPAQRQNMHGGQMTPAMFCAMSPEEWEAILAALAALDEALTPMREEKHG